MLGRPYGSWDTRLKNALKAWYQTYQGQRALPSGYVRLKPIFGEAEGGGRHALPRPWALHRLHVSYFYQRARLGTADRYADVRRTISEIFGCNHRRYGYRRIPASLSELSVSVSEKVVQRSTK